MVLHAWCHVAWVCTMLFLHSWLGTTSSALDPRLFQTTREELLASRKRRSEQLERMLNDVKGRIADHRAGTKLLSNEDALDLERKADIYQRKLDTMSHEIDEREIERILKREELHNERLERLKERRRSEL